MRITIFGAHGKTGLLLTRQALAEGHEVVATSRRPAEFPVSDPKLTVVPVDAYDAESVGRALAGADAVLSVLGVPFTRKPIDIYSEGVRNIVATMPQHGVKRLVVVSSNATEPHQNPGGGLLFKLVIEPLITKVFGKTTYADMRRMEAIVRGSGLDWTIMRPAGLFDATGVTKYVLRENESTDTLTGRADLAASILEQAGDTRFVHKAVAVTTTEGAPTTLQMIRQEAFKKS